MSRIEPTSRAAPVARALARSCHPAPTLAVTAFAIVLATSAGTGPATAALVGAAALPGQLSIGWSNDRHDIRHDQAAERTDKPLAAGEVAPRAADIAIVAALLATLGFSLALGWRAGLTHLAAVGCGWLYNFAFKGTWWSWLPYAAAFGALPAVAVLARPDHPAPAWWPLAAGALLGVTANLTNSLPDLADDEKSGIRGLPHRLGARPSLILATTLLLGSGVLIVFGPRGAPSALAWAGLAVDVLAAGIGLAYAWRRPTTSSAFYGIIVVVAVDVVLIAGTGHGLR
jgi:4-hydroxybenzoate polyprenyltransferase